ncbi:hypothetical protein TRVL_08374 [Trypanosoma vivax]|nr:hypothetical protein TRVL_08374 [Trypanosoma vivax]
MANIHPSDAQVRLTKNTLWIQQLADALKCQDTHIRLQRVQEIVPDSTEASTILGFVVEQLFKAPPTIYFTRDGDLLSEIRCSGHNVTVSVDNAAPCFIGEGRTIQVPLGHKIALSACIPSSGQTVASCCVHFAPESQKNPDELLVTRLLDTFQRHYRSPEKAVDELALIAPPFSPNGQQLLLLVVNSLKQLGNAAVCPTCQSSSGTSNTIQASTSSGNQCLRDMQRFAAASPTNGILGQPLSSEKEQRPLQTTQNEFARRLIDAYSGSSPSTLPDRWSAVHTDCEEEQTLLDLIVRLLREKGDKCVSQPSYAPSAPSLCALEFACSSGSLQDIRTRRPCQLSVDVDGTGFVALEQGGQVPQGYSFPSGSTHCVHIVGRDPVDGAVCAEAFATLSDKKNPELARPSVQPSRNYMDLSMTIVMDEIHLRIICPPELRVACLVDGVVCGSSKVMSSDFIAKISAAHGHSINARLLDVSGAVVFEQRLAVPPMITAPWSVRLENGSVVVDSTIKDASFTASLNRCPEKAISGPIALNGEEPEMILLRQYSTGVEHTRICVSELSLRVAPFVDSTYVRKLSCLYRSALPGSGLVAQLNELICSIPSGVMKDLITTMANFEEKAEATGGRRSNSRFSNARIHFRLCGDESKNSELL